MRWAFPRWRRPEIPLHARIIGTVLAVCLLLLGLDLGRTWQARSDAIAADKSRPPTSPARWPSTPRTAFTRST